MSERGNGGFEQVAALRERVTGSSEIQTETMDIILDPPIEGSNGRTYSSLHLEEPTARMVRTASMELSNNGMAAWEAYRIALVSQGAQVPRDVVEKMRISQVHKAADFLAAFIIAGPAIGES